MTEMEKEIQSEAKLRLRQGIRAAQFSSLFFGPQGRLQNLARTPEERKKLVQTELYCWLKIQQAELSQKDAEHFEQTLEAASGRVTITIPKSLHAALKLEAKQE